MVSVSSDIPEEWDRRWESDFELNPDLHLPAENRFIGQSAFSWRAVSVQSELQLKPSSGTWSGRITV